MNDLAWWNSLTLDQKRAVCRPLTIMVGKVVLGGAKRRPKVSVYLADHRVREHVQSFRDLMDHERVA